VVPGAPIFQACHLAFPVSSSFSGRGVPTSSAHDRRPRPAPTAGQLQRRAHDRASTTELLSLTQQAHDRRPRPSSRYPRPVPTAGQLQRRAHTTGVHRAPGTHDQCPRPVSCRGPASTNELLSLTQQAHDRRPRPSSRYPRPVPTTGAHGRSAAEACPRPASTNELLSLTQQAHDRAPLSDPADL
jgi:hypothetical protein